jgi:hypothetical protein
MMIYSFELLVRVTLKEPTNRPSPEPIQPSRTIIKPISQLRLAYNGRQIVDKSTPSLMAKNSRHGQGDPNNPKFYYDRPRSAASPLSLAHYHPVFSNFMRDCESVLPGKRDYETATALADAMAGYYISEHARMHEIKKIFCDFGIQLSADDVFNMDLQKGSKYTVDALLKTPDGHPILLVEGNNEVGDSNGDAMYQACSYYYKIIYYVANQKPGIFPAFLLTVVGEPSTSAHSNHSKLLFSN